MEEKGTIADQLSELRKKLSEHEERITKLEELVKAEPEIVKKKLSIGEFMLSKSPRSEMERTLTIAYYMEKYENTTPFTAKDLESGFREAKETVPGNINYEIIRCTKEGYVMEAKEKKDKHKAWCLTNTGVDYVERDYPEEE